MSGSNIKSEASRPTDRVMMWRMKSSAGSVFFGALEDGTVFQYLPGPGWKTLLVGPVDFDEAEELIMLSTKAAEGQGSVLESGPCEFGMDSRVIGDIRADQNWVRNDPMLMIAFDMASKTARR
jgi:hypothetical protein